MDVQVEKMMEYLPSRGRSGREAAPREEPAQDTVEERAGPQLRDDLYRAFGVDLTQVPGINTLTAQMLLTEVGPDLSRFPTAATFFAPGLRLCSESEDQRRPRFVRRKTQPTKNRASSGRREWPLRDYTEASLSWGIISGAAKARNGNSEKR